MHEQNVWGTTNEYFNMKGLCGKLGEINGWCTHANWSSLSVIMEMEIWKSAKRYDYRATRVTKIKKTAKTPLAWMQGTGVLLVWWKACKLVKSIWKTVWSDVLKLNMCLLYSPRIPFLSIYQEKGTYKFTRRHTQQSLYLHSWNNSNPGFYYLSTIDRLD